MKRLRYITLVILLSVSTLVFAEDADRARRLRFAWGADLGGNMEMSGHDMSAIGVGASFGMEWQWIRFLGINAEANVMVNNSSRTYPITLNFRTDFSRRRRLVFLDLRGGVAFSYITGFPQEQQPYGSAGLGMTLAKGRDFSSHLILSYSYLARANCYNGEQLRKCPGMQFATMRIGVKF